MRALVTFRKETGIKAEEFTDIIQVIPPRDTYNAYVLSRPRETLYINPSIVEMVVVKKDEDV